MCGRFYIDDAVESVFDTLNRSVDAAIVRGDVRPMDKAAVVACNKRCIPTVFAMRWGFRLENGRILINVRSETAAQKAMFAEALRIHRCIVPMNGYYEWRQVGRERMKYAIHPENNAPVFFAGIYHMERNEPSFAILTRRPVHNIMHIHHRMPVLLDKKSAAEWLDLSAAPNALLDHAAEVPVSASLLEGTEPMIDIDLPEYSAGVQAEWEE